MQTKLNAINSARTQYRAAFKTMALGGDWNLYATKSGVTLDQNGTHLVVLVAHVQAIIETDPLSFADRVSAYRMALHSC